MQIIPKEISKKQAQDTGYAMLLILLILGLWQEDFLYVKLSIAVLLLSLLLPMFFYPLAFLWFGFSNLLGAIMSRLILSLIYFLLVLPIGLYLKIRKIDNLQLKSWKKNKTSVFKTRNHVYKASDLENPY